MKRLLPLLILLALGCDDNPLDELLAGEDAGPVEVVLGDDIQDEEEIKDLDEGEKEEICRAAMEAINDGVPPADKCELAGLLAGLSSVSDGIEAVKSRCEDSLDPCVTAARTGATAAPDVPMDECNLFKGDTSTCTLKVETLRICLQQMAVLSVEALRAFSCQSISPDDLLDSTWDALGSSVPDSTECGELKLNCPGVFESGEGSGDPDAGAG